MYMCKKDDLSFVLWPEKVKEKEGGMKRGHRGGGGGGTE